MKTINGPEHKIVGAAAGLAVGIATLKSGQPLGVVVPFTAMIGCMLPDIDHNSSRLGRKRKVVTKSIRTIMNIATVLLVVFGLFLLILGCMEIVAIGTKTIPLIIGIIGVLFFTFLRKVIANSKTFKWATKHRGLMHTLIPVVLLVFLMTGLNVPVFRYLILGLIVGYLAHILADCVTVEGCPIFFPFTKLNVRVPLCRSSDKKTKYIAIGLSALMLLPTILL